MCVIQRVLYPLSVLSFVFSLLFHVADNTSQQVHFTATTNFTIGKKRNKVQFHFCVRYNSDSLSPSLRSRQKKEENTIKVKRKSEAYDTLECRRHTPEELNSIKHGRRLRHELHQVSRVHL